MRQRLGLVLGWLSTTALAVVLAVAAVGVVSDSVTENRPGPLSPAAVSAALAREVEPDPATTPPSGPQTPGTTPTSAPTTRPAAPPAPATTSPTTATTTRPDGGTPKTTGPTSDTGPVSTTTPTTDRDRPGNFSAPEERTYELVGGTVRVRFADGKAQLLSATPHNGFRIISGGADEGAGGGDVRVRFRSDNHESRLRAYWENGPQAEIEEDNR